MAAINLEHVSKSFGGVVAVDDVSLLIADGEFLVLVGPSGCGKSTLLRMIAGLEQATAGRISIGDRDVTDLAPKDRDIAMVFQTYALYPHMTVRQNLGYGLKARRTDKAEIARRVDEVAALLGLSALLERRPAQLSGGQRQRVAMGRAIAREPQAFLLDEPLSNLDAKLRVGMRASLSQLHRRLGVTTVYVTHDQVEAMTLGQRVAVMRDGHILQVDTPQRLYAEPRDLFVAGFIGSPAMNLVEATVDGGSVRFGQILAAALGGRPAARTARSCSGSGRRRSRTPPSRRGCRRSTSRSRCSRISAPTPMSSSPSPRARSRPRCSRRACQEATGDAHGLIAGGDALFTARVDARTAATVGGTLEARGRPRRASSSSIC